MDRRQLLKLGSLAVFAPAALLPKKAKATPKEGHCGYCYDGNPMPPTINDPESFACETPQKVFSPQAEPYPDAPKVWGAYVSHDVKIDIVEREYSDCCPGFKYIEFPIECQLTIKYEHGEEVYVAFLHFGNVLQAASTNLDLQREIVKKEAMRRGTFLAKLDPSELFAETSVDERLSVVDGPGPIYKIRLLEDDYRLCSMRYWGLADEDGP